MDLLTAYDWPGNVRELSNAIERAMVRGQAARHPARGSAAAGPQTQRVAAGESLADMEKRHIAAVLERTGGNITRAAEILKVDRVTVYNKIKKYGLQSVGPDSSIQDCSIQD